MNNIESIYLNYNHILEEFGKDKINERLQFFMKMIDAFIDNLDAKGKLFVNDNVLCYAILDYFSDISRLKAFHKIKLVNDIKIVAYSSQWILRRKPIQILADVSDDYMIYANEKYVLSYILHELIRDDITKPLLGEKQKKFEKFTQSLYYYLKYRNCDAQALELMILSFKAGISFECDII